MSNKVVVIIADRDDPTRGEFKVVDSAEEAERLIETLLESGAQEGRIHVFCGQAIGMGVSYRPSVSLRSEHLAKAPHFDQLIKEQAPAEPVGPVVVEVPIAAAAEPEAGPQEAPMPVGAELQETAANRSENSDQNRRPFSELFQRAY